MSLIDREKDIEEMNRAALKLARQVADETGTLMAGNICNTNTFHPDDPTCRDKIKAMFKVKWSSAFPLKKQKQRKKKLGLKSEENKLVCSSDM